MTKTINELRSEIRDLGLTITNVTALDAYGYYAPEDNTIQIRRSLRGNRLRSTLAHELVHARLGHAAQRSDWVQSGHWLDDVVDAVAAADLFTEAEYEAERAKYAEPPQWRVLADALGVDVQMLKNWYVVRKGCTTLRGVMA